MDPSPYCQSSIESLKIHSWLSRAVWFCLHFFFLCWRFGAQAPHRPMIGAPYRTKEPITMLTPCSVYIRHCSDMEQTDKEWISKWKKTALMVLGNNVDRIENNSKGAIKSAISYKREKKVFSACADAPDGRRRSWSESHTLIPLHSSTLLCFLGGRPDTDSLSFSLSLSEKPTLSSGKAGRSRRAGGGLYQGRDPPNVTRRSAPAVLAGPGGAATRFLKQCTKMSTFELEAVSGTTAAARWRGERGMKGGVERGWRSLKGWRAQADVD